MTDKKPSLGMLTHTLLNAIREGDKEAQNECVVQLDARSLKKGVIVHPSKDGDWIDVFIPSHISEREALTSIQMHCASRVFRYDISNGEVTGVIKDRPNVGWPKKVQA
jgi:hypothetical protein